MLSINGSLRNLENIYLEKMYVGISTGKNLNYGKKGEKKYIRNDLVGYCRKEGILTNIRKAGSGRLVIRDAESGEEIR